MSAITWLHLSDWHQRGEDFNREVVRDRLIDDIRQRAERIDARVADVDLIVFSGDAAHGGRKDEYEAAQKHLFDPVLDAADLPPERLFLVPGNHDLDWEGFELLPTALQTPLCSEEEVQSWLTDERGGSGCDPFGAYGEFVTAYTGQPQPAYASSRRLEIDGKQIALLGINSAWMCGRPDDAGKIDDRNRVLVGEPQIHSPLDEMKSADIRIAVLHHPLDWLAEFDRERIEDRLEGACHFVLHGHQHRPRVRVTRGTWGDCIVIPAGACYNRRVAEHPRYNNAYNLVHLDLDTGQGTVFLRRWNDTRTEWAKDTETHPEGLFGFRLFEEPEPVQGGVPARKRASSGRRIDPASPPYAELRALLRAVYGAKDMHRLSEQDPFKELRYRFSPSDNLDDMIDEVLEYCRTQALWEELLDAAARQAPRIYNDHASQMGWPLAKEEPRDQPPARQPGGDPGLERALVMARRTLEILEGQAAAYTALTIPAHLQVELEEQRRKVADLEGRLGAGH